MGKLRDYKGNEYRRRYRERHPDKELQWRLNQYARKLALHGWKVTPPDVES